MKNNRPQIIILSVLIFFLLCPGNLPAAPPNHNPLQPNANDDPPLKILFIGSSYFNFYNLPLLFQNLAENNGKSVDIHAEIENGLFLLNHTTRTATQEKIIQKNWDYVILQGAGGNIAYPDYYYQYPFVLGYSTLRDQIYANNPSTKIILTLPWAFEDGWYFGWIETYAEMQQKIITQTLQHSDNLGFITAPVGAAFLTVMNELNNPLHYLFIEDWNHASLEGTYLMACVVYSTIYLQSTVGIDYFANIPHAEAEYFQQVAADTVLTNIDKWRKNGTLYIDTTPINAEVFVDGTSWGASPQSGGAHTGAHTVSFKTVYGYATPSPRQVTINLGQASTVTGTYTYIAGTLSIDTTPASGEVFVDGQSWGTAPQSRPVEIGPHTISFGDVIDYVTPADQQVTVALSQTISVVGEYIAATGTLSIDTFPVKGEVLVDGVSWGVAPQSRVVEYGLHTVSFGAAGGYDAPADWQGIVGIGQTTQVTGEYVAVTGTLSIDTAPVVAEVFIDGVSWGDAPVSRVIATGTYTVSFGAVDDYVTPAGRQVAVNTNQTTAITGNYIRATGTLSIDTEPVKGELFVDGVSWGTAPDSRVIESGAHIVSFGAVADYLTPAAQNVIVVRDQTLTVTATYASATGTLSITTSPVTGAVFVDEVSWGSAPQVRQIALGEHTIGFGYVAGYITPDDQSVVITQDQTSAVAGVYELTSLPLQIDKLTVKSSKQRIPAADSVTLSGRLDAAGLMKLSKPANDHTDASISIVHETEGNLFGHLEILDPDKIIMSAKRNSIKYRHPVAKGQAGRITSFQLDLKKATFTLKAQNVDLSGWQSPVQVQIQMGEYLGEGSAYDGEALGSGGELDVINGKKSLPPNLLMGVTDSLTVTKYQFKSGPKPNTDKLTVEGVITLKNASTSLVNQDVTLQWGAFEITLDRFFPVGKQLPLKYKKSKEKTGPAAAALFDFAKCTYKITLTKANLGEQTFPLDFNLKFANFNQTVTIIQN